MGSSPTLGTKFCPVSSVNRAFGYEPEGQWFDSTTGLHICVILSIRMAHDIKDCPVCWTEIEHNDKLCECCGHVLQYGLVFNDTDWEEFPLDENT